MPAGSQTGPLGALVDMLLAEASRAQITFHDSQARALLELTRDLGFDLSIAPLGIDDVTLTFWLRAEGPGWLRRVWRRSEPEPAEFSFAGNPRREGAVEVTIHLARDGSKWSPRVEAPPAVRDGRVPVLKSVSKR